MKLRMIAEASASRLGRIGQKIAKRLLADYVQDPDVVYELLTTEVVRLDRFILEADRWWDAMRQQWLYLDDPTWDRIMDEVQRDAQELLSELQAEAVLERLDVITEGLVSGFFGIIKKIVLALLAALLTAGNGAEPGGSRVGFQAGGGYGQRRRTLLVRLNSSVANMTAACCLTHSAQALRAGKKPVNDLQNSSGGAGRASVGSSGADS
jgi:hypothetical protein